MQQLDAEILVVEQTLNVLQSSQQAILTMDNENYQKGHELNS